jgi:hypothetical protein
MYSNVQGSIASDESRMAEMINRSRMGAMGAGGVQAPGRYTGMMPAAMNGAAVSGAAQQMAAAPLGIAPLPPRDVAKVAAGVDDDEDDEGGDDDGKDDQKRMRRMLSNRESARRSRRRKQAHLSELEGQVNSMRTKNEELVAKLNEFGTQFQMLAEENRSLKADLDRLRSQLPPGAQGALIGKTGVTSAAAGIEAIGVAATAATAARSNGRGHANGGSNGHATNGHANGAPTSDDDAIVKKEKGDKITQMSPPPKARTRTRAGKVPRSESMQRIASEERLHKKASQ